MNNYGIKRLRKINSDFPGIYMAGNHIRIYYPMKEESLTVSFYADELLNDKVIAITYTKEDSNFGYINEDIYLSGITKPMVYTLSNGKIDIKDIFARSISERNADKYVYFLAEDKPLVNAISHYPARELVTYCMHVKGFTASTTSAVKHPGTFAGIAEKSGYLKRLGINSVELMPAYEFPKYDEAEVPDSIDYAMDHCYDKKIVERRRINYWGFKEGNYFAPNSSYCSNRSDIEFAKFMNRMHREGIEVFLQFYFPEKISPLFITEVLRFWHVRYKVDGFHLIGRQDAIPNLLTDPVFSEVTWVFDNISKEQLLKYRSMQGLANQDNIVLLNMSERNLLRSILKSDEGRLYDYISFAGNPFCEYPRAIHFTSYNGFTLYDLVSYNRKHNEKNCELNRDGEDCNCSWNCGEEGETESVSVKKLRMRQLRNALAMLCFNRGTLYFMMGDEVLRTQNGNNNPYCIDSEENYLNWNLSREQKRWLGLFIKMLRFRKETGIFTAEDDFVLFGRAGQNKTDLSFHSGLPWSMSGKDAFSVGMLYANKEKRLYVAYNFGWKSAKLALPSLKSKGTWRFHEVLPMDGNVLSEDRNEIMLRPRSISILVYD